MRRWLARSLALLMVVGMAASLQAAHAVPGAAASRQAQVQLPSLPEPAPVTLEPTSTAFLALDFVDFCTTIPSCVAALPAVQSGLTAARSADLPIIYTTVGGGQVLDAIAPQARDQVVASFGADKFLNTNLDDLLKNASVQTVVLTGVQANGAVLYTAFEAAARGYTVVVATDGIASRTDFGTFLTEWQLLNGPGTANADNTPLRPKAVTLSRTDLITYQVPAAGK